ncbi:MAG: hypothetical protein U0414_37420 [Polyangiaceae bacterium]
MRTTALTRLFLPIALTAVACSSGGNDDWGSAKPTSTGTSKPPSTTPTTASSSPPPQDVPIITIKKPGGIQIRGQWTSLQEAGGKEKVHTTISGLSLTGKEVKLLVEKEKSAVPVEDVAFAIDELGKAGAATIRIQDPKVRKDVAQEIVILPVQQIKDAPPPCSVVAAVDKLNGSAVWPIKGGTAKRRDAGLGGPDLAILTETLQKEFKGCDSTYAFFTAEGNVDWELAHNTGGTVLASDADKKVKSLVFLDPATQIGKEVTLKK